MTGWVGGHGPLVAVPVKKILLSCLCPLYVWSNQRGSLCKKIIIVPWQGPIAVDKITCGLDVKCKLACSCTCYFINPLEKHHGGEIYKWNAIISADVIQSLLCLDLLPSSVHLEICTTFSDYVRGHTYFIPVASPGGYMWVHKHPVHALVHPCITVACVYCYHTHLAVTIYTCTLLHNHKQQQVCWQCSHVLFAIATCILTAV